jgi:hypothetical protein
MPTADEIRQSAQQILLGKEAAQSDRLHLAKQSLDAAETICFLGFSFNPDNLDKLGADSFGGKRLVGTRKGMTGADVHAAYSYFNSPQENYLLDQSARGLFNFVTLFSR